MGRLTKPRSHLLGEDFAQGAGGGVVASGHFLGHVEAVDVDAGAAKDGAVKGVDGAGAIELSEAPRLESSAAVAEKHDGPGFALGVLLVGVVAGVDDEGVVHHGAAAFGDTFEFFHELDEHLGVVLADFVPDGIACLGHVAEVVALFVDAEAFPRAEDFAATGTDGEDAGGAGLEGRDAEVEEGIMPVGFEDGVGVAVVDGGGEFFEMIGDVSQAFTEPVHVVETLGELLVALLVGNGEVGAFIYSELFDTLEHGGAGFVLVTNVALGNAAVEELIEVVRVGVHEDGLARAACREIGDGGLSLHVVERVHPDAEVGEEGFREVLTEFVVDGGGAGRNAVAAAIPTECSEEGAVGRAGVLAVKTVDDVELFLEGLKGGDGVGENGFGEGTAIDHVGGDAGLGVESLVLHEEDHALGASGRGSEGGGGLPHLR